MKRERRPSWPWPRQSLLDKATYRSIVRTPSLVFSPRARQAFKIYGAALTSSIVVGVLIYLYSLLPWTKWDTVDGVPRFNIPLFVRLCVATRREKFDRGRKTHATRRPFPLDYQLQVGVHTAIQVR